MNTDRGAGASSPEKKKIAGDKTDQQQADYFYAVRKGRDVQFCIFLQWEDCQAQLENCLDADYSVFVQWQDAVEYVKPASAAGATKKKATAAPPPKKRRKENTTTTAAKNKYHQPLHQILVEGYQNCRPKGWRCADLKLSFREPHKQSTQTKYRQDLAELRGTLALPAAPTLVELTATQKRDIQQESDHSILNPLSIRYLNHAWGVNRKYHNDLDDKLHKNAPPDCDTAATTTPFTSCTIECRQAALMRYTPKKLFLNHRVEELTNESKLYHLFQQQPNGGDANNNNTTTTTTRQQKQQWQQQAAQEWEALLEDDPQRQYWQDRAAEHDQLQPTIRPQLIQLLQQDPQRSTASLVNAIGGWCGRTTIAKWRIHWEQQQRRKRKKKK